LVEHDQTEIYFNWRKVLELKLTINDEMVDAIVVQALTESLERLVEDLEAAKAGTPNGVYSWDKEEEITQISGQLDALERVLDWWS
jgi:hypothetical protein